MAFTIDKAMVKTFENNVRHLAQQKESRLRAWVQEKDKTSSSHSFKRIGQQTLAAKAGRRSPPRRTIRCGATASRRPPATTAATRTSPKTPRR
jgi:hypothetical protein